jgi:membrane protein YdbS with pleckstrin-like domain
LGKEIGGRVIKPPLENVTSGKIFKPSRIFLRKEWTKQIAIAVSIWIGVIVGFYLFSYFIYYVDPAEIPNISLHTSTWVGRINYWLMLGNLLWLLPAMMLTPFYINSIEYSVKGESGKTMPEVYVKKGIVTVTRKHVPFRTITNISSTAGAFDRIFGIGNVNIETAGYSGSNQTGPEEKLEGIVFYEEVRDFILNELRKFRDPYVTGTEVVFPADEPVERGPGLSDEILITLREIRDLLRTQISKYPE